MSGFSDDALLTEFVTESREHLSTIEPDLLILEKQGKDTDQEIINRIFRAIHSIKGASGFFGFEPLKGLSHVMENLLMSIRDRKINPNPDVVQPLLLGVDKLSAMLEDLQACDSVPYEDIAARLNALLNAESTTETPPQKTAQVPAHETTESTVLSDSTHNIVSEDNTGFEPDADQLKQALSTGQLLYNITLSVADDLDAKQRDSVAIHDLVVSLGSVLDAIWLPSGTHGLTPQPCDDSSLKLLCGTVLDHELLTMALDIDDSQITLLEKNTVFSEATASNVIPAESPQKPTGSNGSTSSKKVTNVTEETVRVKVDLLNKLIDLAGEMVLSRNQLLRTLGQQAHHIEGLDTIAENVNLITSELQEHIMQTRMQPIGTVFNKFPRIVRDLAMQLGKEIDLQLSGEDVELDKSIIESLSDPLTHLIRNACDHALETPDERQAAGKSTTGSIHLSAFHAEGQINIAIIDDGRGIDAHKVGRKAVQNGLVTESELAAMSPQEIVNMVFLPGFSTADKISDVSGRGVGMDVVRTNIVKMGGTIQIDTTPNQGTRLLLRLPLTLAIIPSLIVGVSGQRFAMPQISVVEMVLVRATEAHRLIEDIGSSQVLRLREKLLPLLHLADILNLERRYFDEDTQQEQRDRRSSQRSVSDNISDEDNRRYHAASDYNIIVVKVGLHQFGLVVDELFDIEEIVVKPLSKYLKSCTCFSGATIMGDGRVAMILDAAGILAYTSMSFDEIDAEKNRQDSLNQESANDKQTILLFNNGIEETFAMYLQDVMRLEKIQSQQIERMGGHEVITYEGKALPLIRLEQHLPVSSLPSGLDDLYLIIPKSGQGSSGILASRILDTVESAVTLEHSNLRERGLLGSAIMNDRLTMFIEPEALLNRAGLHTAGASR